jgi:hypothetical protein
MLAESPLIVVIEYSLVNFSANFISLVLAIWLIELASASYAFLIGAVDSDAKPAQEIAPALLVPQLIFAG